MSDISLFLTNAKETVHRAITIVTTKISLLHLDIDRNYAWDGGDGLLEFDAKGAGTQELSQNMSGLSHLLNDNPELLQAPYVITPEIHHYLEGIADARGITVAQAEQDYKRFLDLTNAAGIELSTSSSYGSISHLRFGFVVGEALNIDPAFASLMSPNGGLTGPGGTALNIDGDGLGEELLSSITGGSVSNEALAYHAPTHDAFGFLNKNFDVGPGYCYVPDGECLIGDENPLSGQFSGINYWDDKLGLTPIDAVTDAGGEIGREFNEAGREISDEFSEAGGEILREAWQGDPLGVASEMFEGTAEVAGQTLEGGLEMGREALEGVVDFGNELKGDGVPFVPGI